MTLVTFLSVLGMRPYRLLGTGIYDSAFGSSSGPFVLGKQRLLSSAGVSKQSVPHESFEVSTGLSRPPDSSSHCGTLVVETVLKRNNVPREDVHKPPLASSGLFSPVCVSLRDVFLFPQRLICNTKTKLLCLRGHNCETPP